MRVCSQVNVNSDVVYGSELIALDDGAGRKATIPRSDI